MPHTPQEVADVLTAIAALLVALGGLLGVVLVQARKAKAEATKTAAETKTMLEQLRADTAIAAHELQHNHGSSVKDSQTRTERQVSELAARLDQVLAVQERTNVEVRETRAEMKETRADVQIMRTEMRDDRASLDTERQARQDLDAKADRTHTEIFGRLNRIEGKS